MAQFAEYVAAAGRVARARAPGCPGLGEWRPADDAALASRGLAVTSLDYDPSRRSPAGARPLERFPGLRGNSPPIRYCSLRGRLLRRGPVDGRARSMSSHPDASLEELRRVLRPGGLLYCHKLPNRRSYLRRSPAQRAYVLPWPTPL